MARGRCGNRLSLIPCLSLGVQSTGMTLILNFPIRVFGMIGSRDRVTAGGSPLSHGVQQGSMARMKDRQGQVVIPRQGKAGRRRWPAASTR